MNARWKRLSYPVPLPLWLVVVLFASVLGQFIAVVVTS